MLLAAGVGGLVAAAIAWSASRDDRTRPPARAATDALSTVTVERRDLLSSQSISGKLGYADERPLLAPAGGAVTALPAEGSLVRPGQILMRIDGKPVVLLDGAVPLYRTMREGTVGRDVRQLERDLHRLGYDASWPMTIDGRYTAATAAAVRRLQRHLAVAQTGELDASLAVFLPGARRVGAIKAQLGARVGPGAPVMETTSLRREVTLSIDAAQRTAVRRGEGVGVTLPSGARRRGRIDTIGRVARDQPQGTGRSTRSVVDLTIRLRSRRGLAELDEAPVSVALTSTAARDVLVAPVTALRARPGGGYAVLVPGPGAPRLLPVVPGTFSGGFVALRGSAVHAGMKVLVPSETL